MKNKVGLGFTFCTVHRFAGLINGRSFAEPYLGTAFSLGRCCTRASDLAAQTRLENNQASYEWAGTVIRLRL